jgi:hypothetical protein
MNIQDAAHRIGHEYPGGAGVLAQRMGINAAVFNSKLNPNTATHHLTLVEALRMQQLGERFDILHAMAEELGHVAIPMAPSIADTDVSHALATTCAEFGDFLRRVDATMRDGLVKAHEIKKNEKELLELIAAATKLHSLMAGMIGKRKA